ncbi:MAG TPA: hypothetical protein VLA58_00975, partial [Chitinophagaceae bacterium]|nr:hypothetical protein [Chitinophagaceae bacterium]
RQILGDPFPGVTILDDPGTIVFGPNAASQVSLFKGRDLSIVDVFKWVQGNHVWSTGIDFGFSWLNDMILPSYFGNYVFGNLNDFLLNGYPVLYQRTLMRSEQAVHEKSVGSSAKFMTSRLGFFLQDEWKITPELQLKYGVRIDGNSWNTAYPADEYFNKTGVPAISAYYDLQGARSGQVLNTHWQLQPRVELISRLPDENVVLKFGAGVFTGHILNIWATDIYNYKTASLDVTPSAYNLGFNPDVNAQPGFSSLGLDPGRNKGNVVLITPDFKYPTGIRMSSSVWKMLGKGWNVGLELLLTRNLHEISYTNVNLLPPTLTSAGVGPRTVYAASGQAPRVPMDGGNPYNNILLMANNNDRKGNSYSMTASLNSPTDHNSFFSASYTYGHSKALFEPTATSGPNLLQWRSLETIHGRNNSMITTSDFDMMHRICIYGMRKFNYAKGRASTTFSFFYQGQSGQPYSYVYGRSMVNDFGPNASIDLIYVPTTSELQDMIFIPITGPNGNYTPDQQKAMLDEFIESDRYLRKIRGSFSERNKARLPFTHTVDIRIQQEFNIKAGSKNLRFGIVLDVFNVLNLLNSEWGRTYQIIGDNISLVKFEKYISATRLFPQYQFSFTGKPWSVQSSTAPGSSARWISQLGFRFYL